MKLRLAVAALVAALCAHAAHGQQAQEPSLPTFRIEVDAVEIDAIVTDARGNPVLDLRADDFEILEEGTPQTIASLTLVNIPIEHAGRPLHSPTAVEPDIFTNQRPEGRLYVFALDEVGTTEQQQVLRTRHFLRRFIEQNLGTNDTAALVYVGRGLAGATQDFTSNKRLLLAAVDRYTGGFLDGRDDLAPSNALPAADQQWQLKEVRDRMKALRALVESMAAMGGGRKVMIYVTERLGDVYSVLDYSGGARAVAFEDLHAAIVSATRANVAIYPVHPAGLAVGGECGIDCALDLRGLAEATGGFAILNTNTFEEHFERLVAENSAYYVLGFTSTNGRREGRFRNVQVRVRQPGLTVRARAGYLEPLRHTPRTVPPVRSTLPPSLAEALASPLPNPSVPVRFAAVPFKGPGRDADVAIAIDIDPSALGLMRRNGLFEGEIALATAAIRADGRRFEGRRLEAKLSLQPDSYERTSADAVRVISGLRLPPGRYQLRVAGGTNARAGSVVGDLEVPDFTQEPLALSGIALTSSSTTGVTITPNDDRAIEHPYAGVFTTPMTTRREFEREDTLHVYAEVYESARRNTPVHTLDVTTELRSDDGRAVFATHDERSSAELKGRSGGYGFSTRIRLADVQPGLYVIHVEARANTGDRPTVSRDIPIRVR